jgi:hypothetical protein
MVVAAESADITDPTKGPASRRYKKIETTGPVAVAVAPGPKEEKTPSDEADPVRVTNCAETSESAWKSAKVCLCNISEDYMLIRSKYEGARS